MKKSSKTPWMPADAFGRSLAAGLGVNLLVRDIAQAMKFQTGVLEAETVYEDEDFAVLSRNGSVWMLHADHTYLDNPMTGVIAGVEGRGAGIELRLYDCDPDDAAERARRLDFTVLAGAADKPHGLREAYIVDDDGYVWVPGRTLAQQ